MSTEIINHRKIIDRVAEALGIINNDKKIAEHFGNKSVSSIANYRNGGTIPLEPLVRLSVEKNVSLDYIIFGKKEDALMLEKIEFWKNKYLSAMEELNELNRELRKHPLSQKAPRMGKSGTYDEK